MKATRWAVLGVAVTMACTGCPGPGKAKATVKTTTTTSAAATGTTVTTTFTTTSGPAASVTTTAPITTLAPATTKAPATTPAPTTVAPTTAPPTTAKPAPVTNPCSGIDFKNRTYTMPDFGVIAVVNGQGARGSMGSADYAAMQVRNVIVANIGGASAAAETIVHTNVNTGGTGQFSDVQVYTCSEGIASLITSAGAGDRADDGVRAISSSGDGRILIDRYSAAAGACCPTEATRQGFTLVGTTLTASGAGARRKIISLDGSAGDPELTVSFLPGTSGALLFGDTATARVAGLDAAAGQTLRLSIEPPPAGLAGAAIDVIRAGAVLGSVVAGNELTLTLPAAGHYQLKARPVTAGSDAGFDGEIAIT